MCDYCENKGHNHVIKNYKGEEKLVCQECYQELYGPQEMFTN